MRAHFLESPQRAQQGYTVVELMMAMGVMTIGIMGVFAMQKVTISSNQQAKSIAIATHIAQAWLDELASEAGQWNATGDFEETVWLGQVGVEDGIASQWIRPVYSPARNFGPAFDALGSPVATADIVRDARFCSDIRLTWLNGQETYKAGGGLIRAQVRVFWRRAGVTDTAGTPPRHACDITPLNLDTADGIQLYHVVYLSTAVRQYLGEE